MISHTTERFRRTLSVLPDHIKRQSKDAYRLFRVNPYHPSLRFKQVHPSRPIYSVRINRDYRALAIREGDELTWFWIGSHSDYDRLVAQQ